MENKTIKMEIKYLENGIEINNEFISLKEITEKCNEARLTSQNLVLMKIEWTGRGGEVYEHRVLPKETVEEIKELLIGKEVYFGEIWGKHSEVYGEVREKDFSIVEDKKEIKKFLSTHPNGSDYNHSFINTIVDHYLDYGGREWAEEEFEDDGEYADDIERLKEIAY